MDSTANGNLPCDIANTPFIFGTNGLCGVGMNFRRALQRFRKFTTLAFQFTPNDVDPETFSAVAYTGVTTDILSVGFGGVGSANGYPAAMLPTMTRKQTNLGTAGRPCPVGGTFVVCAIEAIAEPLKIYDTAGGSIAFGAQVLESVQAYIQHEVLRSISLTYSANEDACTADSDPLRFYLSQYGKGFLNNASHNGVMVKNNVIRLPALLPIMQGASETEANVSKLAIVYDANTRVQSGAYLPGFNTTATPDVAAGNQTVYSGTTNLLQEITIVLDGFCMTTAEALRFCQPVQMGQPIPTVVVIPG